MVQLVTAPTIQALDANGAPYSGAKLYTYVAGTSTPLTVYQDDPVLTPHTNPVIADSSGRFAPIYTTSTSLKLVLKTSADVTIQTIDPVVFSIGAGITDSATATVLTLANSTLTLGALNGDFAIQHVDNDRSLALAGGVNSTGALITLFGPSHATTPSVTYVSGGTLRILQNSTDTPGAGNNTTGHAITAVSPCLSFSGTLFVNRTASGSILSWDVAGVTQGTVSEAAGTITYGTFNGSHEAQLANEADRVRLMCGMILETVDEQSQWGDKPDRVLPKVKISDTLGSRRVYGVFFDWYDANPEDDTANSSSLGAYVIRIAPGEIVQGGDLIESNGDGYGKVQADEIIRSSTVAKITSAVIAERYADGSFLVPCTLLCG